ncbi:MAG: FHA domain-containing protein [bacterium]
MLIRKQKTEIVVTMNRGSEDEKQMTFTSSFKIGREASCDVHIADSVVSGHHIEILFENGQWWLHDLHSTNGTFLDGELVHKKLLHERATLQLGKGGPIVSLKVKQKRPTNKDISHNRISATKIKTLLSITQVYQHYFSPSLSRAAGPFTIYLRGAFKQAIRVKTRKLLILLSAICFLTIAAFSMIWYQHRQLAQMEPLATNIFYNMKRLELQIARFVKLAEDSSDPELNEEVRALRQRYQQLQFEYDNFITRLGIYDDVSEEEQLILRIARIFGECEINAPKEFIDEVKRYIKKWQKNDRLQDAIGRSLENGYHKTIAKIFLERQLPPQYIYLAVQESGLDVNSCGPETQYGIAKGMWQFIPKIALAYGLKVGPLLELPRADPRDERHDFEKSTRAAAKLIEDLYNTTAQGSGLLVVASYNWGIGNLQELIEQMPPNPEERNFWNLVKNHKIPQETYDYVFYIVSAAVIGEKPALFGFDFENILKKDS